MILNFNRKSLVRRYSNLSQKEIAQKRVYIDSPITLADGEAYISSQWTATDMPQFLEITRALGFDIQ